MTSLTRESAIGEALTRLAVGRAGMLDDITSEVYLDRLQRFDPDLVRRACDVWVDVPRGEREPALPDVGKIIDTIREIESADAARASAARLLPMPADREDEPRYFCLDCRDDPAGWRLWWCQGAGPSRILEKPDHAAGQTLSSCGRHQPHTPHTFADRCACLSVNPVIAAHRRKQREFREKREAEK